MNSAEGRFENSWICQKDEKEPFHDILLLEFHELPIS